MKIIHTADWHLNDRLGRIDRTDDLRKALERVATHCREAKADVLLVAGDLFSELARADALRETIHHWQDVFSDFLTSGGTILTLTGNHDNENFCRTLRHAMTLAAPTIGLPGEIVPPGRLYLAADPSFLRLRDRSGDFDVQFILMPYPTPSRYLKGETHRYTGSDEKNQLLTRAFEEEMQAFRKRENFNPKSPAVLGAHVHVFGSQVGPSLFRLTEQEDIVISDVGLHEQFAYAALGHIHKPQYLSGHKNVRYSGSIERMDLGEQANSLGVVLFEIGPKGLVGEPEVLPLTATPIYEITVLNPTEDLPRLQNEYPEAEHDLVNLHINYVAGEHNLENVLCDLEKIFPRWYARDWREAGKLGPTLVSPDDPIPTMSFADTVRDYLTRELVQHSDEEQKILLGIAEELLKECEE